MTKLVKTHLVAGTPPSLLLSLSLSLSVHVCFEQYLTIFCTLKRSVSGNSILDHLTYFGVQLSSDTWGSCRIIMDNKLKQYHMDAAGNIVMSRDSKMPSFLKLVSQNNTDRNYV